MSGQVDFHFDISLVHRSKAEDFTIDRGRLEINWSGQPTYWRKDIEVDGTDWGIRYNGCLDKRMQYLYDAFLEERDFHEYRPLYLLGAEYLEGEYRKFSVQLNNSLYKTVLWTIQSAATRLFAWLSGSSFKSLEYINPHPPKNRVDDTHSAFYHEVATCRIKQSEIKRVFGNSLLFNITPYITIHSIVDPIYGPCEIEFSYDVWSYYNREKKQNPELTILEAYKFFLEAGYKSFVATSTSQQIIDATMQTNCFRPETDPFENPSFSNTQYLAHSCVEAGLGEIYLQDFYAIGDDNNVVRQEHMMRFKSDITPTRLQVASLSLLKYLQHKTQNAVLEAPDFLVQGINSSALQTLSEETSQLTEEEVTQLRECLAFGSSCSSKLFEISEHIQTHAKTLRDSPQFLRAFFDLPLPQKPVEMIEND
ncbi:MAG: hypothetical protein K2X08_03850 [Chlamydiales bacterium]|nr:hypothetical protein [Chlamydiales bacterium]